MAHGRLRHTRAFSLAELMIALAILGLGLLFIASALPVGIEYTRQAVDQATGEAAAREALKTVERRLHTSAALQVADAQRYITANYVVPRVDPIVRPRFYESPSALPVTDLRRRQISFPGDDDGPSVYPPGGGAPTNPRQDIDYEPFIKVRPLVMQNISIGSLPGANAQRGVIVVDDVETAVDRYLEAVDGAIFPGGTSPLNVPVGRLYESDWLWQENLGISLAENPVLPAIARVFPSVKPEPNFTVDAFLSDPYKRQPVRDPAGSINVTGADTTGEDTLRAAEERIGWTSFYRRVQYDRILSFGADNTPGTADDVVERGDPLLYEIIVVVTRRSNVNERFPRQKLSGSGQIHDFDRPIAVDPSDAGDLPAIERDLGGDRILPTPWLVLFDVSANNESSLDDGDGALPVLQWEPDTDADYVIANVNRPIRRDLSKYATMKFHCTRELAKLLPVGSRIIPAVNDQYPNSLSPATGYKPNRPGTLARRAGFVPHQSEELPIYKVTLRPDETTVVVESNGTFPWVAPGGTVNNGYDPSVFPVWIIPPTFENRDASGEPIYSEKSPIIGVQRKVVRLSEIR